MTSTVLRLLRLLALVLPALIAEACLAHPMGNFSINHYSGIYVGRGSIEVLYIIDRAEIPTYQEIQDASLVPNAGDASLPPYLAREASEWAKQLTLAVNGETVTLVPVSRNILFAPGAGGLPTMKIAIVYRGSLPPELARTSEPLRLHYTDANFEGHAGWKEIVVSAEDGVTLDPAQPFQTDRSAKLSDYPTSLLNSPPQDLEASIGYLVSAPALALEAKPAGAASVPAPTPSVKAPTTATAVVELSRENAAAPAAPAPAPVLVANRQATPRSAFTELMARPRSGPWFLLTAILLAAALGALHALEPGHGKTVVAAYLVGSRGRARHAVGLGLLVTAAHTAGVYLLGAAVLYASKYIIPERIYPWLSIFSGLVISVLAGYLLLRAWTGLDPHEDDEQGVLHTHWYAPRRVRRTPAEETAATQQENRTVSLRQLLVLGITGGIIPCPAALVVLLSAISLHRIGFGLLLIVAFSAGLAAVLIAIGLLMVHARSLLSRWRGESPWMKQRLPMLSAGAMFVAGLAIAASALPATGLSFSVHSLANHQLGSFLALVGLGLVLGMRHSTDPDHVVAVSTIVSRERSIGQGAVIGMMWGFGHTLTIFLVGAAIILFKLTIPPRIGLSMEMTVAAMLIVLGVLNLTGVLQRITERLTPGRTPSALTCKADAGAYRGMVARFGAWQLLRPLGIGLVHGLAGSAAVALLVLSMIHSTAWAVAYLLVFGFGTVAGMMLMTTVMAIPVALTGKSATRFLTTASGLVSVCFGMFLVYHLGFVDGLFTSHVHWTPE